MIGVSTALNLYTDKIVQIANAVIIAHHTPLGLLLFCMNHHYYRFQMMIINKFYSV